MTGPEHYREAERLINVAAAMMKPGASVADVQIHMDAAQVHATLALAAATALGTAQVPPDGVTAHEWRGATCVGQARS